MIRFESIRERRGHPFCFYLRFGAKRFSREMGVHVLMLALWQYLAAVAVTQLRRPLGEADARNVALACAACALCGLSAHRLKRGGWYGRTAMVASVGCCAALLSQTQAAPVAVAASLLIAVASRSVQREFKDVRARALSLHAMRLRSTRDTSHVCTPSWLCWAVCGGCTGQCVAVNVQCWAQALCSYINDIWNVLDVATLALTFAFLARMLSNAPSGMTTQLAAINTVLLWLRSRMLKTGGP